MQQAASSGHPLEPRARPRPGPGSSRLQATEESVASNGARQTSAPVSIPGASDAGARHSRIHSSGDLAAMQQQETTTQARCIWIILSLQLVSCLEDGHAQALGAIRAISGGNLMRRRAKGHVCDVPYESHHPYHLFAHAVMMQACNVSDTGPESSCEILHPESESFGPPGEDGQVVKRAEQSASISARSVRSLGHWAGQRAGHGAPQRPHHRIHARVIYAHGLGQPHGQPRAGWAKQARYLTHAPADSTA